MLAECFNTLALLFIDKLPRNFDLISTALFVERGPKLTPITDPEDHGQWPGDHDTWYKDRNKLLLELCLNLQKAIVKPDTGIGVICSVIIFELLVDDFEGVGALLLDKCTVRAVFSADELDKSPKRFRTVA
ncbi:hypothetical protein PM082_021974 [Marasmius tenuissimus]|nr:hypothetical protein PM082_021974 [Marasmius tenuissimus]